MHPVNDSMAQWQRVGFQSRRLRVRFPLGSFHFWFFSLLTSLGISLPTKTKQKERKKISTPQRFELWRAEPNRFLIYLLNHSDMVSSTGSYQEMLIWRQRVRVVKEVDSKSTGLCPREFKSRRCRSLFFSWHYHRDVHPSCDDGCQSWWYVQVAVELGQPPVVICTANSPVV